MTEMEKMEAVKRAYAEMILNTAKEAAERVMAAELRARRTEQELVTVKEDAANMLLRLKQMIDAKTKEAEITSLNQKKKFEELESQLNEAEEIILDLREELNQEQEQLDKLKKKQVPLTRQNEENAEECILTPVVTCSGYELLTSSENPGPEFCTIGTQITCANETSLEKETFSIVERLSGSKNFTNMVSVNAVKSASELEENAEECSLTPVVTCSGYELLTSSLNPEPAFSTIGTQITCATETSLEEETFSVVEKLSGSKNFTNMVSLNAVKSASELEEKIQHGNSESVSIVRRSVRKRKLKFWGDVIAACGLQSSHQFKKPRQGSADLSCLATRKMKRCVKNGEVLAEGRTKIESLNDAEVSKELRHAKALTENMELIDVLVKQDELAANFELTSASRIDCDVEDGTAANASKLSHADGNKLCKYTFNRRWRKKSVIYPEKVLDRGS